MEFQDLTASYLNVSESYLSVMFDGLRYEERQYSNAAMQIALLSLPSYHDLKTEQLSCAVSGDVRMAEQ